MGAGGKGAVGLSWPHGGQFFERHQPGSEASMINMLTSHPKAVE